MYLSLLPFNYIYSCEFQCFVYLFCIFVYIQLSVTSCPGAKQCRTLNSFVVEEPTLHIHSLKISFNLNTLQCPATCRGKDGHLVLGKVVPCVLCAPLVMTGNNCTLYLISCALESYQTVNGHTQPYFAFIWPWSAWPGRQHTNICQCLTS